MLLYSSGTLIIVKVPPTNQIDIKSGHAIYADYIRYQP